MKKIANIFILFSLFFLGCTSPYDPQVNGNQQFLVVDGLITNTPGRYNVNLSLTNFYNSNQSSTPVLYAYLEIQDNMGNTYILSEGDNGNYFTNSNQFIGIVGRTYILYITTAEGVKYQSAPQLMTKNYPVDSIYGKQIVQSVLENNGDGPYLVYYPGVRTNVDINLPIGSINHFRFKDSLLIEMATNLSFWWNLVNLDNTIPLTGSNAVTSTSNIKDFNLDFFESTIGGDYLANYVMFIHQYSLNMDSYNFYNLMNGQLSAGSQLFDPVEFQVKGNITCTSNSNITALGKFEASADTTYAYIVNVSDIDQYQKIDYFSVTRQGTANQAPSWWK